MRLLLGWLLMAGLTAGVANAQTVDERARLLGIGTVNTQAQASTRLPNTVADVTAGVEVTGKDVAEVTKLLSARSGALLGYLRSTGAERLTTGEVSFEPQTHTSKAGVESIVGYTATTTVSFRTTPDKLGEVLAGVLNNGANRIESTVQRPREAEIDNARRTLADEATRRALAEAEAVAKAAGEHVLNVREITIGQPEVPGRPYPVMSMMKLSPGLAAGNAPPVAVASGEAEVSVTVSASVLISH